MLTIQSHVEVSRFGVILKADTSSLNEQARYVSSITFPRLHHGFASLNITSLDS